MRAWIDAEVGQFIVQRLARDFEQGERLCHIAACVLQYVGDERGHAAAQIGAVFHFVRSRLAGQHHIEGIVAQFADIAGPIMRQDMAAHRIGHI